MKMKDTKEVVEMRTAAKYTYCKRKTAGRLPKSMPN